MMLLLVYLIKCYQKYRNNKKYNIIKFKEINKEKLLILHFIQGIVIIGRKIIKKLFNIIVWKYLKNVIKEKL